MRYNSISIFFQQLFVSTFLLQSTSRLYCFIHDISKMTFYQAKQITLHSMFSLYLSMDNFTSRGSDSITLVCPLGNSTYSLTSFVSIKTKFIAKDMMLCCSKINQNSHLVYFHQIIYENELSLLFAPSMSFQLLPSSNLAFSFDCETNKAARQVYLWSLFLNFLITHFLHVVEWSLLYGPSLL